MTVHVLLNLVGEKDQMRFFPNEFNKFNNTGARIKNSIYHMTLKSHCFSDCCIKTSKVWP